MSKTRDLADFVSAGNPLADGTIDIVDINGATITLTELNYLSGTTSAVQTQINTIQTDLDTKASTGKAIAMAIVFG